MRSETQQSQPQDDTVICGIKKKKKGKKKKVRYNSQTSVIWFAAVKVFNKYFTRSRTLESSANARK